MSLEHYIVNSIIELAPVFATFYLVALGHSLFEKAGLLDLAIDGAFFMSSSIAVGVAVASGSPVIGTIVAAISAMLLGAALAFLMTSLPISHGAIGLSMMFLGYGIGIIVGYPARLEVGSIAMYAYGESEAMAIMAVSIAIGVFVHIILKYTKLGAAIRACGENPHAAASLGVNVLLIRLIAGAAGFAIMGAGSSFFTLAWQKFWDPKSYTLGYGWLAFTAALTSGRHPIVLMPISLVFGGLIFYRVKIGVMYGVEKDVANLVPFIAALAAMLIFYSTKLKKALAPPASLGKIYYREERTI